MCSEQLPKKFEKTTEVLPFDKYGLSSFQEFKSSEDQILHLEWLKKIGLSGEEIKLYQQKEAGLLDQREKIHPNVLRSKLEAIYNKINTSRKEAERSSKPEEQPSTSCSNDIIFRCLQKKPITFYPEGHPMNDLKELEESLFGHLKNDDIIPITKRRKILRRLERKKERILLHRKQGIELIPTKDNLPKVNRPGSLWDVKEIPVRVQKTQPKPIIGPKKQTMYTIKDNKIVRLEPVTNRQELPADVYRAVDIVIPINTAEEQLLEGTKMCVDDIRKIERFKDYEPGTPSKVLYLKNVAPAVTQDQLALLFNQFQLDNGGPVEVRLMSGRMRGQAFVSFQNEDLAVRALDELNGTVLSGKPIIVQFGRNSNRIQDDNR